MTYEQIPDLDPFDVVLDQVGGEVFATCLKQLQPLGAIIGIGYAGGQWAPVDPALLVGRNATVVGFFLGRFMKLRPEVVRAAALELLEQWSRGRVRADRRGDLPARRGRRRAALGGRAPLDRQGRARAVSAGTALVTGGASGIGAAIVERLEAEGFAVESLDLTTGFDVTDPSHWDAVGPVDVACLNAGVLGGPRDPGGDRRRRLSPRGRGQRRRRRAGRAQARSA